MATEAMEVFCQCFSGRTMPADSPGSGMPVLLPNPKRRTYSYIFFCPTVRPILMAPMLLDRASTSSMDNDPIAAGDHGWCAQTA